MRRAWLVCVAVSIGGCLFPSFDDLRGGVPASPPSDAGGVPEIDSTAPVAETCNGRDDNHDGHIDEGVCTPAVKEFRGHAYLFVFDAKPWPLAKDFCAAHGYHLVTINDADEGVFIGSVKPDAGDGPYWIGYNDRATEGTFVWDDGTPKGFENWGFGAPNDFFEEDCAGIYPSSSNWDDLSCEVPDAFVCEAP